MKKITFFLTSVALIAIIAKKSFADNYNYSPYVGIDYTYNHTSAKGVFPYYHAAGVHIGSDYSEYFATELFFSQSNNNKRYPKENKLKTSYRSYGIDLLAFAPLPQGSKLSLLGTAGIGEYVFKIREFPQKHHNEHGFGYRFGGGLKYAINEHWQSRFITRYVKFNHIDNINHSVEYSLGIEYHF